MTDYTDRYNQYISSNQVNYIDLYEYLIDTIPNHIVIDSALYDECVRYALRSTGVHNKIVFLTTKQCKLVYKKLSNYIEAHTNQQIQYINRDF